MLVSLSRSGHGLSDPLWVLGRGGPNSLAGDPVLYSDGARSPGKFVLAGDCMEGSASIVGCVLEMEVQPAVVNDFTEIVRDVEEKKCPGRTVLLLPSV